MPSQLKKPSGPITYTIQKGANVILDWLTRLIRWIFSRAP